MRNSSLCVIKGFVRSGCGGDWTTEDEKGTIDDKQARGPRANILAVFEGCFEVDEVFSPLLESALHRIVCPRLGLDAFNGFLVLQALLQQSCKHDL